jgi:cell division septation protein DedD
MYYILAANKRRSVTKSSRKVNYKTKSAFRISWLLVGLILGVTITSFAMYGLKDADIKFSLNKQAVKTIPSKIQASTKPKTKPEKKQIKPKFEFYNELTKLQNKSTLDLGLKKQNTAPTSYTIQAGSFSKKSDAEQLKAELALKGFDATISMVKLKTGQKWYRVNVGSFQSQQELVEQQKLLAEYNIDSSLVTTAN